MSPGDDVTITGSGWLPDSTVALTLFSDPISLGTAEVDEFGDFETVVTIPVTTPEGTHTVQISGTGENGQPKVVTASIQISATTADYEDFEFVADEFFDDEYFDDELPFNGSNTVTLVVSGGALVLVGLALVAIRRRSTSRLR